MLFVILVLTVALAVREFARRYSVFSGENLGEIGLIRKAGLRGYLADMPLARPQHIHSLAEPHLGDVIIHRSAVLTLEACDERGLLVFTEIPGWQHIGDEAWKQIAMKNTEEMVLQYRNHPSIILWGVRINESMDEDALYTETNRIAHALDSTRQTSGVRYIRKSSLLEDVYAYNDFSHQGNNAGC